VLPASHRPISSTRLVVVRTGALVIIVLSIATACGSGSSHSRTAARRPAASRVVLRDFVLQQRGVVFWMHPTEARIRITGGARLNVCEVGTTFSHYWIGGCRELRSGSVTLPTSGGAVHIGFRVKPANGHAVAISNLALRWHCVDHFCLLEPDLTRVHATRPIFDC
jgi:hypothetical protein